MDKSKVIIKQLESESTNLQQKNKSVKNELNEQKEQNVELSKAMAQIYYLMNMSQDEEKDEIRDTIKAILELKYNKLEGINSKKKKTAKSKQVWWKDEC